MDIVFLEGVAAVASAVIVFIGSVFLLLALIMGARLAYFVTAAVTLGFVFIMTLVWSQGTPLGPVGQLPEWEPQDLVVDQADAEFGAAGAYPEQPWRVPNEDDPADVTKAGELESAAIDYLKQVIEGGGEGGETGEQGGTIQEGQEQEFLAEADAAVVEDSTRLLTQGDQEYGALRLEASQSALDRAEEADPEQIATETTDPDATAFVVMRYDPGNPLGQARMIAAGTFVLFVAHLFGLSRVERKSRQDFERPES